MGDKSAIEWTDATWNPVTGCTKVSQGCKNCYAERVFPRAYGRDVIDTAQGEILRHRKFTDVQTHPDRLDQPLRWKKPRRIFVNSMSDLFHESVPFNFIDRVFDTMRSADHHTYQILTKRPERMQQYVNALGGTVNWKFIHLGVSCEDQETADERIPLLLQTPAAVRFISAEPLLGEIDLTHVGYPHPMLQYHCPKCDARIRDLKCPVCGSEGYGVDAIDWVIVGGESGPNARPMHPDWARSLRDQCQAAGVAFFFKQWGGWTPKMFYAEPGKGSNYDWGVLDNLGNWFTNTTPWNGKEGEHSVSSEYTMLRVGKKKAGAELDGKEWKEFPTTV